MAYEMSREELVEVLLQRGIAFPRGVHIDVLRNLFNRNIDAGVPHENENQGNNEAIAAANVDEVEAVEEQLDAELRILEKRQRIAQLKRELAAMNLGNAEPQVGQPKFEDIKHSVSQFSGADQYDARKWLNDFESACDSVYGDDLFRLRSLRRLMKPDTEAEWFLQTDRSASYGELRQNFLKNFGHEYSVTEILDKLRSTVYSSAQMSTMGYVLKMQEIASRADVDEKVTIRCIIDGFKDNSVNIAVLYPAQSLDQLKKLVHEYEHLRKKSAKPLSINKFSGVNESQRNKGGGVIGDVDTKLPLCYNCSGRGHFSNVCPHPKRKIGSCFRCGSTSHKIHHCPKPASPKGQIALVADKYTNQDEEDDDGHQLSKTFSEMNMVSVSFSGSDERNCNTLFSLFDSGSPISLIRRTDVPNGIVKNNLSYSGFNGLNNFKLFTFGQIDIIISFKNIRKTINVYVVEDESIPYPLILGRNFLREFNINFSMLFSYQIKQINPNNCSRKIVSTVSEGVLNCVPSTSKLPSVSPIPFPMFKNESDKLIHSVPDVFAITSCDKAEVYDVNPILSKTDREAIINVILSNYSDLKNIPVINHDYKMHISLSSDVPISFGPRRLSYADKQLVDKNVKELLSLGYIRPSASAYSFPLVLAQKKDGSKRQCVDYRALNKVMVKDSYPLPLLDDCLETVEGKHVFTILDLKNGFHHIKVAEDSVQYTAFVTPSGHYEYVRMPFGLKNGPGVFQRFIHFVLKEFVEQGSVVVYMDDITLATNTMEEHLVLLSKVLYRLAEFRLELNFSKCQFAYYEITLLGFSVSNKGIRPSDRHLKAIKNLSYPKDPVQVQKCLGLFSFFRRFIPSFSTVSAPLRALTKPTKDFNFDDGSKRVFDLLREKLLTAPVLALYNPTRETELHCDASSLGFGGILLQKQDDGKFHPIAYFSKGTTPAESRYHSYELETLAIIYSLRKFRIYLEGMAFRIITDCNSLALTLNGKSINARIARWSLELSGYDYTIQHRPGPSMAHVDYLSRFPPLAIDNYSDSTQVVCAIDPGEFDSQLRITQSRDEEIVKIRDALEIGAVDHFALEDGLVYRVARNGSLLFYVPKEMEESVIRQVHEKICHMGVRKCTDQIKMHYWFPYLEKKVERFCSNCIKCIVNSVPPHANHRTLHHIPKAAIPFDTLHLDHFGPLPAVASRRKHILLVVDAFTKYVKLFAVNSTSTKEVCECLTKYFQFYSRPRRVITDRGSCFTSLDFSSFIVENNIDHVKVATASAQANGQVERVNRVIKAMLAKVTEPLYHSDWSELLIQVEYAINNSIHSVTRHTPSELLFGVNQKGPQVDILSEHLEEKHQPVGRSLVGIRENASNNIQTHQQRSSDYHASKIKPHKKFEVGEYVVIRNVETTAGLNKKFVAKYKGPYEIHKVLPNDRYVVRDIDGCQQSQMPYDGILEACRIRHWADWRDTGGGTVVPEE